MVLASDPVNLYDEDLGSYMENCTEVNAKKINSNQKVLLLINFFKVFRGLYIIASGVVSSFVNSLRVLGVQLFLFIDKLKDS